jgi:hypothetical protein
MYEEEGKDKISTACAEFEGEQLRSDEDQPIFFIAQRGECSFVQKIRNMEDAGVSVGIIIDTNNEEIEKIIMSDDGTGDGIIIPAVIISQEQGDILMQHLRDLSDDEMRAVVFSATFSIAHPDNRVEYDIWYTSSDDRALDFISNFATYHIGLGSDVLMTPRFVYWQCIDCDQTIVNKHCWVNGKYCAIDSNNDKHNG